MRLALRAAVVCLVALLIGAATLPAADAASAHAHFAPKSAKPSTETAPPAEIQALLKPAGRSQGAGVAASSRIKPRPLPAEPDKPSLESPQEMMSTHVEAVREHLAGMAGAMPDMPAQFAHAADVFDAKLGEPPAGAHPGAWSPLLSASALAPRRCFGGQPSGSAGISKRIQSRLSVTASASSPSARPLRWARWLPMPSAASAPFSCFTGQRCCARSFWAI